MIVLVSPTTEGSSSTMGDPTVPIAILTVFTSFEVRFQDMRLVICLVELKVDDIFIFYFILYP